MASKGEKAKSKKTTEAKKMTETKSKKEENIIIVFEYSKEMYNEMLRKKEVIEKNTLYLLLITSLITVLLVVFNGLKLTEFDTLLNINNYLYIGTYAVLILSILVSVTSLKNTFIKKKLFRYLFKKLYKIDIYKELELKDKIDDAVKSKEKGYKRKLTRDEKKRVARKTVRESCCYRELDDPVEIMKISKKRYSEKTDKFYEYLIKSISSRIKDGNVINKTKQIGFNFSLCLFVISMILLFINTMIFA